MSMTAAAKVTTNGDMVYATAANTLARLGIGSTGQVLTVAGGIPTWETSSAAIVLAGSSSAATSTTSTSAVDLVTISGLNILVTQPFRVEVNGRKTAAAAQAACLGIKINSTNVLSAGASNVNNTLWLSSSTQQAEDGIGIFMCAPRSSANYLAGMLWYMTSRASASGLAATTQVIYGGNIPAAVMPNATITSIVITAQNYTTSNAIEVTSIRILTGID
jgi:hypothetical protein